MLRILNFLCRNPERRGSKWKPLPRASFWRSQRIVMDSKVPVEVTALLCEVTERRARRDVLPETPAWRLGPPALRRWKPKPLAAVTCAGTGHAAHHLGRTLRSAPVGAGTWDGEGVAAFGINSRIRFAQVDRAADDYGLARVKSTFVRDGGTPRGTWDDTLPLYVAQQV